MGIFGNKNGLHKATEKIEDGQGHFNSMIPALIMMNDGVNICATACASCWDTKLPDDYFERAKYIGRRTKTGHTSIIEHSNVVFYLFVPMSKSNDLLEFLDLNNYLHTCVKKSEHGDGYYALIGGTWRGFSDLFLNCYDMNNTVLTSLINSIYNYIPSDGLRDIIDHGILEENMFANINGHDLASRYCMLQNLRIDDDINIVNCDDIYQLMTDLQSVCDEAYLFTVKDLLKFCTVTIEFNNMSRIITQQLTRHRNGITQESQRYVDYSGAKFNSPAKFKPDKYNAKRLYEIRFGGQTFKMNLQGIGDAINKIYEQLKDKSKYGTEALLSEDARGYLSQNTQCGKVFMTFTYYSLIKFLQLREDSHAQAEIRSYGDRIGRWFRDYVFNTYSDKNTIYDALIPNITALNTDNIFMGTIGPKPNDNIPTIRLDKNEVGEPISDEEFASIYENSIKMEDDKNKTE